MSKNDGALPAPVAYLFRREAKVLVSPGSSGLSLEKCMDAALEVEGISDLNEYLPDSENEDGQETLDVRCDVKDLSKVRGALEGIGLQVQSIELVYESSDKLEDLPDEEGQKVSQILEWLDEHMDVTKVYHNLG
jgi:transcriptional/translational regulatory protein YebC/TACO1